MLNYYPSCTIRQTLVALSAYAPYNTSHMRGQRKYRAGFTIIELIVVIVVLGILATLTTLGLRQYLTQSDDAQRKASATVIAEALEKYHAKTGEYPSCTNLVTDGGTVTSSNGPLAGLDAATIVAPGASGSETNSIRCVAIDSNNSDDYFGYVANGCGATACLGYSLQYREVETGAVKEIKSRYEAQLGDCGPQLTLTSSSTQFTRITPSWNAAVAPCSDYQLQVDTSSSFNTGNLQTIAVSSATSYQVTGLTSGVTYYFRVAPLLSGVPGYWSNTISRTTLTLPVSGVTAVANSNSQITVSWSATTSPASASTYDVRYSTASNMSGATQINNTASTSQVITGLATSTTYYVQVRADTTSPETFTGAWYPTSPVSVITIVPAPTCNTATVNNNRQITAAWSAVSGASSYTLQYATNSSFTSASQITGITGTSRAVSSLNNATTYYFRVKTVMGSNESAWSNTCPSATTGIDGPTGVGWAAQPYGVRNADTIGWMPGQYPGSGNYWTNGMSIYGTCAPGATVVTRLYSYYAYSNNTSPNDASLLDWSWGNQVRFVTGGTDSWYVWWQGWVACQTGSTRVGDTYLGNVGPY